MRKRVNISIDKDLHKQIQERLKENGQNFSWLIEKLLSDYLKQGEKVYKNS